MTEITVAHIRRWLEEWAPPDTAEEWDNVGLLAGRPDTPVARVLTALDVTPAVVRQAAEWDAQLIVSHHPIIFRSLSRLDGEGVPYRLARHGLAALSAHTNLDRAAGGVNDVLAAALDLREVTVAPDGLVRVGRLEAGLAPADFAAYIAGRLDGPVQWAGGGCEVRTVAVCGGAGGDYLERATALADAYVTGELHYHDWPAEPSATIVAAGHWRTEIGIAATLASRLKAAFPTLDVRRAEERRPYEIRV